MALRSPDTWPGNVQWMDFLLLITGEYGVDIIHIYIYHIMCHISCKVVHTTGFLRVEIYNDITDYIIYRDTHIYIIYNCIYIYIICHT